MTDLDPLIAENRRLRDAIVRAVRALEHDLPDDGYDPAFGSQIALTIAEANDLADMLQSALSPTP